MQTPKSSSRQGNIVTVTYPCVVVSSQLQSYKITSIYIFLLKPMPPNQHNTLYRITLHTQHLTYVTVLVLSPCNQTSTHITHTITHILHQYILHPSHSQSGHLFAAYLISSHNFSSCRSNL